MQLERSEVALYVYTANGSSTSRYIRSHHPSQTSLKLSQNQTSYFHSMNLTQRFELTNAALQNMNSWPNVGLQFNGKTRKYDDKTAFQRNLDEFRDDILHSNESTITDVLNWYTSVNAAMMDHLTNQIKETDNSGVWRYENPTNSPNGKHTLFNQPPSFTAI